MGSRVATAARGATSVGLAVLAVLACWLAWRHPHAGLRGAVVVLAPLALLFWWTGRVLLEGLLAFAARADRATLTIREVITCLRLTRVTLVLHPLAISISCLAACAGLFVLGTAHAGVGAGWIVATLAGGTVLRVVFGSALVRAVLPALPVGLRRDLAGALRGPGWS